RAVRVEVGESWTRKTLVKSILFELGVQARGTIADMTEQAKALLGDDPRRPLIVDEADKLVDKGMIELVREIGEVSLCPVILIGEERLPKKLAQIERVHNRVLEFMAAQPCDLDDTIALAGMLYPRISVGADLLEEIRRQSQGRARRIVVNLARVAELARNRGLAEVDRAAWGGTAYYTSKAPEPRNADSWSA
ncbi:AAA family ATPase, partial [Rhodoplanes sp. SY1]|uniref:AAA family ATPase n=1 Tax=Rhodoplanes sp. SY1 TaxID=3166646 RepID=UPI0038B64E9C